MQIEYRPSSLVYWWRLNRRFISLSERPDCLGSSSSDDGGVRGGGGAGGVRLRVRVVHSC